MPENIYRKTRLDLESQLSNIDSESLVLLVPPSLNNRIYKLSESELKERYPYRYGIYINLLRGNDISDSDRERLHMLNNLDRYVIKHRKKNETTILRDRQMTVFSEISRELERGSKEAAIKAPTGFGKTILFNQVASVADTATLIVVPTKKLVEQTHRRFVQFNSAVEVGRVYSSKKEFGRKITITTYSSLVLNTGDKLINPHGVSLVILDEFHEGTSGRRIRAMEAVEKFGRADILGFSATPAVITNPRLVDSRVGRMSRNLIHKIS